MKKIIKCGQLFTAEDESVQHNMCIVIEDNNNYRCYQGKFVQG